MIYADLSEGFYMIPYILLIMIPAVFCFVCIKRAKRSRYLCVGDGEYVKSNNLSIAIFFLLFFILLALRDETVGTDIQSYKNFFDTSRKQELSEFLKFEPESLFKLSCWLIGSITAEYRWVLIAIAAFTLIPIYLLYNEDKKYSYLKIIIFVNMPTFIMIFSGLRQSIAMAIGMIAFVFVRKKKWIAFLITVILALGFHHSAFIMLFMYPLYHISFKRKHLLFIVPAALVTFVFNRQIFTIVNQFLAAYNDRYDVSLMSTGAVTTLVLFILFAIFCFLIPDESLLDRDTIGLRNFLVFSVFLQCFAPVHTVAMRMNYYFILFIPMLLPKVLQIPSPAYRQVAKVGGVVMSVFFTFYFFYTVYIGCTTGVSALNTYPYVPFWN